MCTSKVEKMSKIAYIFKIKFEFSSEKPISEYGVKCLTSYKVCAIFLENITKGVFSYKHYSGISALFGHPIYISNSACLLSKLEFYRNCQGYPHK